MAKNTNPDVVFGNETAVLSGVALHADIAGLAASLGVATPAGNDDYEPDAFIQALLKVRDDLTKARDALAAQSTAQRQLAIDLDPRERKVAFREKRVAAFEQLVPIRQSFVQRLIGR